VSKFDLLVKSFDFNDVVSAARICTDVVVANLKTNAISNQALIINL